MIGYVLNALTQILYNTWSKRFIHQPPKTRMIRRIYRQHPGHALHEHGQKFRMAKSLQHVNTKTCISEALCEFQVTQDVVYVSVGGNQPVTPGFAPIYWRFLSESLVVRIGIL